MPHPGIENGGVTRLHDDIGAGCLIVYKQGAAPGLSSIRCLVYTSFVIGPEEMAFYGYPDDIGIARMYHDAGDMAAILLPQLLPALSLRQIPPRFSETLFRRVLSPSPA